MPSSSTSDSGRPPVPDPPSPAENEQVSGLGRLALRTAGQIRLLSERLTALGWQPDGYAPADLAALADAVHGMAMRCAMHAGDTVLLNQISAPGRHLSPIDPQLALPLSGTAGQAGTSATSATSADTDSAEAVTTEAAHELAPQELHHQFNLALSPHITVGIRLGQWAGLGDWASLSPTVRTASAQAALDALDELITALTTYRTRLRTAVAPDHPGNDQQ